MSYCQAILKMESGERRELHQRYHDHAYGYRITSDNELFGRLILEINQAGLSWETILKKEQAFRNAYAHFDIASVAAYTEDDKQILLQNAGIIRNRLKIEAAIYNANRILELQKSHGTFLSWLDEHHPLPLENWVKLFKKTFKFVGGEIVNEFLMSTGYLAGAHDEDCPIYHKINRSFTSSI